MTVVQLADRRALVQPAEVWIDAGWAPHLYESAHRGAGVPPVLSLWWSAALDFRPTQITLTPGTGWRPRPAAGASIRSEADNSWTLIGAEVARAWRPPTVLELVTDGPWEPVRVIIDGLTPPIITPGFGFCQHCARERGRAALVPPQVTPAIRLCGSCFLSGAGYGPADPLPQSSERQP
jgi:hypothetical protein